MPLRLANLVCLTLLASTAEGRAQGGASHSSVDPTVDPAAYEWFETNRTTGFPFGYPDRQVVRYQEVHDGLAGNPRLVSAIAIRRSANDASMVAAFDAVVSMRLSTAGVGSAAMISARFADNEGPDVVIALPERSISFPATSGPATGLAPFDFVIPADVPFAFGGTGPLCVEIRVASHTNTTQTSFALASENATLRATPIRAGCGGLELSTSIEAEVATHTVGGSIPGSPVVIAFGFDTRQLGGAPLPLDLTPLGGPGCSLAVAPVWTLAGSANYFGSFSTAVDLFGAPSGTLYFCQALSPLWFREPSTSPRTLLASGADAVTIGQARVAGRTWAEDLTASQGQRQPVFGLVLEIR